MIDKAQENVSGVARLKLYRGGSVDRRPALIASRSMIRTWASFDEAGGYQQADAEGFIRLPACASKPCRGSIRRRIRLKAKLLCARLQKPH